MDISLPALRTPTDLLAVVPYLSGFAAVQPWEWVDLRTYVRSND